MNPQADIGFGPNGELFRNYQAYKALLTLNICLTIFIALTLLAFFYYLRELKNRPTKARYFNRGLIKFTLGTLIVTLLLGALNYVFYYKAEYIFSGNAITAQNTIIALIVIDFAVVFITTVYIWFRFPEFGIAIGDDCFWFLGENLHFSHITKIINDERNNLLYINYSASVRTFKYYRLKTASGAGQFLINHLPAEVVSEVGDQKQYFQELSQKLPSTEK